MNIFLVDCGKLFTLSEGLISRRVSDLQANLAEIADIPIDKQVILTAEGGSLDPNYPLAQYSTALSNDRPLFLFSKSSIECNVVPHNPTPLPSDDHLKERLSSYQAGGQSCDSLKLGADLAQEYKKYGEDVLHKSKQLVQDQQYQRDGWSAVMKNLDMVSAGFRRRVATFQELYTTFADRKEEYKSMLGQFENDVKVLAKIPLSKGITDQLLDNKLIESIRFTKREGLGITESMRDPDPSLGMGNSAMDQGRNMLNLSVTENNGEVISLLDWIEAQDSQNSLHSLVIQCTRAMDQLNEMFLPRVLEEVEKVNSSLVTPGMREIKGLDERLRQLSMLLDQMSTITAEQSNYSSTMKVQQERFMHQGDISVLSDLSGVHQKQLHTLDSNNKHLKDLYNKFAVAKTELSSNLLMRLAWVTHCQKQLYSCDGRLTLLAENLLRVRRRFDILEQINIAPSLYCACLGEIYRRSTFQRRYKHWGSKLREKVEREKEGECEKRDSFASKTGSHFLTTLFRGLESRPPVYVAAGALEFDTELFEVSNEELITLANQFPDYSQSLLPVRGEGSTLFSEAECKETAVQCGLIGTDKYGAPCNPELGKSLERVKAELSEQVDRNVKAEMQLRCVKDSVEEYKRLCKDHEEQVKVMNNERISALQKLTELQAEAQKNELKSQSLQSIANHADEKYQLLKDEAEGMKIENTGLKMENNKMKDLIENSKKELKAKEKEMQSLRNELDSLNTQTAMTELVERHRIQLRDLRSEIENKSNEAAKVKLEELRVQKDDCIAKLTAEYQTQLVKLNHGNQERLTELEEAQEANSKLTARVACLLNDIEERDKKVKEEQETGLIYKAEGEKELKILHMKFQEELEQLRNSARQTETTLLERVSALSDDVTRLEGRKVELESALSTAGSMASSSTVSNTASVAVLQEYQDFISSLETTVRQKDEEILRLNEGRGPNDQRCVKVAMNQFTKGDIVIVYYNAERNNYLLANSRAEDYLYFVHPDNLSQLGLSLQPPQKPWCLAQIKDKEFCQARKVNNRFKVQEGTKFYRVYAYPYIVGTPPREPTPAATS